MRQVVRQSYLPSVPEDLPNDSLVNTCDARDPPQQRLIVREPIEQALSIPASAVPLALDTELVGRPERRVRVPKQRVAVVDDVEAMRRPSFLVADVLAVPVCIDDPDVEHCHACTEVGLISNSCLRIDGRQLVATEIVAKGAKT